MSRPNILFVFPDQLSARWHESAMVYTPRLDQFAESSTRFTHAYSTSPVCTPYRACLLTGRYPSQTRVRDNGTALPGSEKTIAYWMNETGYTTYYLGKWHLSGEPHANRWVPPDQRGEFTHFTGWESHHVDHMRGLIWQDDPDAAIEVPGHETDGLTDLVLDHIEQGLQEPFCLFVSYQAPHPPCSPLEKHRTPYRAFPDQEILPGPNVDPDAYYHRPEWNVDYNLREFRERYFGEITHIDEAFGRILEALDRHDLTDNTVVIFTSDHGEMAGAHDLFGKGNIFDEAVRIPLLVRLPGQTQAAICDTPISTVDFLPTLLNLAGVESIPDTEGASFAPALLGEPINACPVFCEYGDWLGLITPDFKLMVARDTFLPRSLYHADDSHELQNLVNDSLYTDQIQQMQEVLQRWRERIINET